MSRSPAPRPPEPSLRAGIGWTLAGNLGYAACQWGMVVALAKVVAPEMLGRFALALAVAGPVIILANLQLRVLQATDAARAYAFGDYAALRALSSAAALAAIVAIACLGGYPRAQAEAIAAAGVWKAIEAGSELLYGLLQQHERMAAVGRSLLLKGALSLAALALVARATGDVLPGIFALAAVAALVLALHDAPAAAAVLRERLAVAPGELRPSAARVRRLLLAALPLGAVAGLVALHASVPRFFVHGASGEAALGVFAAIGYISVAGSTAINAAGQAAAPRLARFHEDGQARRFRGLLLGLAGAALALGVGGVAAAVVAGRPLLGLVYGPGYAEHAGVLVWFMVAAALSYVGTALWYPVTAARRVRLQPLIHGGGVLACALACTALVPSRGIAGAAQALVVSFGLQLAGMIALAVLACRDVARAAGDAAPAVPAVAAPERAVPEPAAPADADLADVRRAAA